jgi:hypothetical protein
MESVKWLARIEAVEAPFQGEFQSEKYVYAPGVPVSQMKVKSMFTGVPPKAPARAPMRIAGLAWGGKGIARVEVAVDGEWQEARLTGPVLPHAWRRFELQWTLPLPGLHRLRCRATDTAGETQPDRPCWNQLGYGMNAVEEIEIEAR